MDWRDPQAVLSFLESLPRVFAHADGPYTYVDRARDFAAVFNGTSGMEQGRRVFAQIAQICDPTSAPADANQHGTLAFKAGARWVMAQISMCFVVKEPLRVERAPQQTER